MTPIIAFGILVALTIGIVEVIKRALKFPKNIVPLLSVIIGIVLLLIAKATNFIDLNIFVGIVVGLSASGLFDQKKILGVLTK